jgi:hypothetical protein
MKTKTQEKGKTKGKAKYNFSVYIFTVLNNPKIWIYKT